MEVGIFGGTFNPIHLGHLIIAEKIRELFALDRLLFITSAIPPHKEEPVINSYHRLNMVELAIESNPYFFTSPLEVNRAGKSYTIDTIKELRDEYGRDHIFYFIIGVDAFRDISTWKNYTRLLKSCKFIVINRPGISLKNVRRNLSGILADLNLNSKEVCENGQYNRINPAGYDILFLHIPLIDISSTRIRFLAKKGKSFRYQVPEPVERYIIMNRLYLE